jgi:hypothetical protein
VPNVCGSTRDARIALAKLDRQILGSWTSSEHALSLGHSAEDFFGSSSNTGRLSGQIPPPKNLVKENEDGAVSRDNGEGWDAIILREKDGHYLGSSSIVFPKLLIHHL